MSKNVAKLISPRVLCTSVTNRVLSWFDRFMAYYQKISKLISPRVLCTNITNRVLSWFDRFTAYYNCMSKNVKKFISPRVLCTCIKIVFQADLAVLLLITTVWAKISQNSYLREICALISQIVFLDDLTVLRLIITVLAETSKTHISSSSVHKYQKPCC